MTNVYHVIKRPVVTEKGLMAKEANRTLCLEVDPSATKTDIKAAVETIFKVKVESVRTANFVGKERRRQVLRVPSRLEEGLREVEGRRKDGGVRSARLG